MLFSDVFDKVVVINLPKDTAKLAHTKAELCKPFEIVEGVEIDHPDKVTRQKLGNRKAHIKVLELAKAKGWQNVLVFEDDIIIDQKYKDYVLGRIKPTVDRKDWAVFYLGGKHRTNPIDTVSDCIVLPTAVIGTHAIAYEHYHYDQLIKTLSKPDNDLTPVDYCLSGYPEDKGNFLKKHNCYCAFPRFVYQQDSFSVGAGKFILSSYWYENLYAGACK